MRTFKRNWEKGGTGKELQRNRVETMNKMGRARIREETGNGIVQPKASPKLLIRKCS